MSDMVSTSMVANKLSQLAQLYKTGGVSSMMSRTVEKLLDYETEEAQKQLRALEDDLSSFEKQYSLSTAEFYQRYQTGKTDDRMDYVEWASLAQMANNLRNRLAVLTGKQVV
jgi:hypothetical protein